MPLGADCADKDVVHGDIKPDNVLIFDGTSGEVTAKIVDFAYSARWTRAGDFARIPSTKPWNAPEWHLRGHTLIPPILQFIFASIPISIKSPHRLSRKPAYEPHGRTIRAGAVTMYLPPLIDWMCIGPFS
jgi:serine/threonine protein kinase